MKTEPELEQKTPDFSQVSFAAREDKEDPLESGRSLRGRTWRRWRVVCALTIMCLLAATSVVFLQGYRPSAPAFLSSADYMQCMLMVFGGACGVAWSGRSLFDEKEDAFVPLRWVVWMTPAAAFISWAASNLLLAAYLRGWQPAWPFFIGNPFGLLLTTYLIGFAAIRLASRIRNLTRSGP